MLKKQPNHVFFNNWAGWLKEKKTTTHNPTTHSLFAKFLQPERSFTDGL